VIFQEELPIAAPLAVVRQRLLDYMDRGGLDHAVSAGFEDGQTLLARAGLARSGVTRSMAARSGVRAVAAQSIEHLTVHFLPAYVRGARTVIPIRWLASDPTGELSPTLDGNLELTPADDGATRLIFVGSYVPAVGRLGPPPSRRVLLQITRATVLGFLSCVAGGIREPATPSCGVRRDAVARRADGARAEPRPPEETREERRQVLHRCRVGESDDA
jgi:hypothetical protein